MACAAALHAGSTHDRDFFENSIRPLLVKNCHACHTSSRMGGLELDSREHLLKGGNSGPAVLPGKPDESLLIQAVRRTHPRLKMPPQAPLRPDEVAALELWVSNGAIWPETAAIPAQFANIRLYLRRASPALRSQLIQKDR